MPVVLPPSVAHTWRHLCKCGKPKETRAFICRACYLSSVRQPIKTRRQAAAALADYFDGIHDRERAAA